MQVKVKSQNWQWTYLVRPILICCSSNTNKAWKCMYKKKLKRIQMLTFYASKNFVHNTCPGDPRISTPERLELGFILQKWARARSGHFFPFLRPKALRGFHIFQAFASLFIIPVITIVKPSLPVKWQLLWIYNRMGRRLPAMEASGSFLWKLWSVKWWWDAATIGIFMMMISRDNSG